MKKRQTIIALAGLLLFAASAQSQTYPGYRSPWQAPPSTQYNYAPPNQRPKGTPSTQPATPNYQTPYSGGWPQMQQPGYGQPGYTQPGYAQPGYSQTPYYGAQNGNGKPPRLEMKLSANSPFVQENLLLRLNVISSHNLKTANPQLPQVDNLVFQKLEGPTASSRSGKGGSQEIVTGFIYQVTPLRPGRIEIPTIRVTGEQEGRAGYGRGGSEYDAASQQTLALNVKPTDPSSNPWLPLEQLTLQSRISDNGKAVAGKPITLTIEMNAVGASGNLLPSLERQLRSDAFRVYRERTRTDTKLNKKGTKILGQRVESFTLVPQFGGELQLPDLRLPWWNTRTNMPQHASVPVKPIAVSGGRRGDGVFAMSKGSSLFPAGTPAAFWIPVSIIFGVIFGYWMAVWLSNRRKDEAPPPAFAPLARALQRPFLKMAPAFAPLGQQFRATTACLNPITRWQKLRRRIIGMMPLSIRFWFCVRCVDEENDPDVWGYTLRFLANKHLNLPARAPFAVIGDRILEFHPKADPARVQSLIHDLDQAVYGHTQLDFEKWKEAFKHEIRPRLRLIPGSRKATPGRTAGRLPTLNPQVAA